MSRPPATEGGSLEPVSDSEREFAGAFDANVREKGLEYVQAGSVTLIGASTARVDAIVQGTVPYSVALERVDDSSNSVSATCTCPHRRAGNLCKHIWAVFVAAQDRGLFANGSDEPGAPPGGRPANGSRLSAAPSRSPSPAPRSRGPTWKDVVRQARGPDEPSPRPIARDRELVYLADLRQSTISGRFVLRLATRRRLPDGSWTWPQSRTVRKSDLGQLSSIEDRAILECLFGADESPYSSPYATAERFSLNAGHLEVLLPRICRTGRLFLESEKDGGDSEVLGPWEWDDAGTWELRLCLEAAEGDKPFSLTARLRRGEGSVDLGEALLLSSAGFFFARGKAASFRFDGNSSWINEIRRTGSLPVERKDAPAFLEEVFDLPGTFGIDLPPDLKLEELRGTPRPFLMVTIDKKAEGKLNVCLSFEYPGALVAAFDPQDRILRQEEKQIILRDRSAEAAEIALLPPLGFKRVSRPDDDVDFQLTATRLSAAVQELVARGWQVEAEAGAYRLPGAFRISVSSGIDWFDLGGGVDYGGEVVPFPRLLEALRRGQNFVKLSTGGVGLLPEEWLARKGLILSSGEPQGDALRFRPGQALLLDALLVAEGTASCDETFRRLRDDLGSFRGIASAEPPAGFRGTLRPYQKVGLGWMEFLRAFRLGGCLADDMGLGKTVTVLALLESRREVGAGPSLIVLPRSLLWNWKAEAARFAPSLRLLDYTGDGRARDVRSFADVDLVLTTYGTLRRDAPLLKDARFDYVILDEAQAIKNAVGVTAKAARLLKAEHRLALSGTPIENHLGELWSLMEFLTPGLLGKASVFASAVGKNPDEATQKLLARALRPFFLRRTKSQVAPELPPKVEETLTVDLGPHERKRYDELREHYRRTLLGGAKDWKRSKFNVLEALLRLRQAACHLGLLDHGLRKEASSKVEALLERVREVLSEGHKALVFSQFTTLLAIVKQHLDRENITYEYLDGQTVDRAARVERFQKDPDCPLFLVSLKAGGLGLNLTAAEYVFLLDPWWNPAVEAQAIDRAHRIGQERHVFAYRLVARDTVEEKVLELQKSKRALAEAILLEDRGFLKNLTREDLTLLLS